MYHPRLYIIVLLFLKSLLAMSQSHDFEIRDFHENPTDLTTVSANVKDLNGKTAALIRFAVRDTLFSFEPNNGIILEKKAIGEVQLFVPQGTKRITIRHPHLGILRDYQLPVYIESKTTYDAEIVITNSDYLRKLMGGEQRIIEIKAPDDTKSDKQQGEKDTVRTDVDDIYWTDAENQKKPKKPKEPRQPLSCKILLGGGFNAINMTGPQIAVGIHLGKVILSADYTLGMQKVEGVGIYYKASSYGEKLGEAYDYSVNRLSVRLGFANPNASVQLVPLIGASFNMIKGKEIVNLLGSEAQFAESNPISFSAALSLRIRLYMPLLLAITPQYDFAIGKDEVYKVIKDADSKVKAWAEGFGVCAGLLLSF